nr:MAG TPA: hypothetical protein [Caudoviricetes sp.]
MTAIRRSASMLILLSGTEQVGRAALQMNRQHVQRPQGWISPIVLKQADAHLRQPRTVCQLCLRQIQCLSPGTDDFAKCHMMISFSIVILRQMCYTFHRERG